MHFTSLLRFCALVLLGALVVPAAVIYNEAVTGDLSNSGLTPTLVTLASGSNDILGVTGRDTSNVVDRDYLAFTIPAGLTISSITVLSGTTVGGPFAFIGMQAGNQVTLPTNTQTAAGLLGWDHYNPGEIGQDILGTMSVPAEGSSGFSTPLAAGTYALWIQDFSPGSFNYGFSFAVTPGSTIPEPATDISVMSGGILLLAYRRRNRKFKG
jgi:hypothetical protein